MFFTECILSYQQFSIMIHPSDVSICFYVLKVHRVFVMDCPTVRIICYIVNGLSWESFQWEQFRCTFTLALRRISPHPQVCPAPSHSLCEGTGPVPRYEHHCGAGARLPRPTHCLWATSFLGDTRLQIVLHSLVQYGRVPAWPDLDGL